MEIEGDRFVLTSGASRGGPASRGGAASRQRRQGGGASALRAGASAPVGSSARDGFEGRGEGSFGLLRGGVEGSRCAPPRRRRRRQVLRRRGVAPACSGVEGLRCGDGVWRLGLGGWLLCKKGRGSCVG
jgi:hypothetical protein